MKNAYALIALTLALSACGGGGSGSSQTPTTPAAPQAASFPLLTAMKGLYNLNAAYALNMSGTSTTLGVATPMTEAVKLGLAAYTTPTTLGVYPGYFGGVTIGSTAFTITHVNVISSNYSQLGSQIIGGDCIASTPVQPPASVLFGAAGVLGTFTCAGSSLPFSNTYELTGTASAPVLQLTSVYPTPTGTETDIMDFSIDTSGKLTFLSLDLTLATATTVVHLKN